MKRRWWRTGALLYLFAYACSFMPSVEASGTTPAAAVDAGVYEGAAESITAAVPETSGEIDGEKAVYLEAGETLSFTVQIPKDAAYTLGLLYCPGDDKRRPVEAAITVDGLYPFEDMEKLTFPKLWENAGEPRVDGQGNEFAPEQILVKAYTQQVAVDITGRRAHPFTIDLTAGEHVITVKALDAPFALAALILGAPEVALPYEAVYKEQRQSGKSDYTGEQIELQGIQASLKSTESLIPLSDGNEASLSPSEPNKSRLNYIGGTNWNGPGDTLTWKFHIEKSGWYTLGIQYRQNYVLNGSSYRWLKIDGQTPFAEAEILEFPYGVGWAFFTFGGDEPYRIYLEAGDHELSLAVTLAELSDVVSKMETLCEKLGDLYLDMVMITGTDVDVYRDYDLYRQIPNFIESLNAYRQSISELENEVEEISGKKGGSTVSLLRNMRMVLDNMCDRPYEAHRFITNYYNVYCSLTAGLYEMSSMPLDISRILLASPQQDFVKPTAGFFRRVAFSVQKFFGSFVEDYSAVTSADGREKAITLWVNWGRDQAQILNSLIQEGFTPDTGIGVQVKLTNASLVQAILSGNGPDCVLQQSRTTPVDLAIRGGLLDLKGFPDFTDVASRFQDKATLPYEYNGGCYALPDTQNFFMMFYRTDIFQELGLKVPNTWDEFLEVSAVLQRNNLECYLPYTQIVDMTTINSGVGGLTLFPTLLLQNGINLYADDLSATTFQEPPSISVFTFWTDFYTKQKFPVAMDFYNRFRTGTAPLGIQTYSLYTTLAVAAPEIDGRWAVVPIPGVESATGEINRVQAGSGTGCSILALTDVAQESWGFLKWWTSEEVQLSYSNSLESVLGTVGRHPTATIEAFRQMGWDKETLQQCLEQWQDVEELPEVPGGYYVARGIDQAYWNIVNMDANATDMLLKWGKVVNEEISRKRGQYGLG
jgi:ABC-type glycerol-3-phosphate transport system substrate-binding protein